jgi:uncharacterized protein
LSSTLHARALSIPFGTHTLKGDILSRAEGDPVRLVLLHGAGQGTRARFRPLRLRLAQYGVASLMLDFVGHGATGGAIRESSLMSRTEQACAGIQAARVQPPFGLLGSSMGGYNAVKLLERCPVQSLALFVPAMYHPGAYVVPFGAAFTQVIRRPQSWAGSDAWSILERFHGRLLLVTAGRDDVIPAGVLHRIEASAKNASLCVRHDVADSPHLLIQHLNRTPADFERVFALLLENLG